ncbi:MAG: hypothetical protein ACSLE1_22950 [Sphingobium sp.]
MAALHAPLPAHLPDHTRRSYIGVQHGFAALAPVIVPPLRLYHALQVNSFPCRESERVARCGWWTRSRFRDECRGRWCGLRLILLVPPR